MLGIIILNYKSWNLVQDCIDSIYRTYKHGHFHIYIVDGGSQNESLDRLREIYGHDHRCTIIDAKVNKGFAYGNNLGAKRAIKDGCSKLLITNSDIVFLEGAIDNMCTVINSSDESNYQFGEALSSSLFLVYPVVYNSDNTLQLKECFIGKRDKFYDIVLNNNVLKRLVPKSIFYKYFSDINDLLKTSIISKKISIKTNMFFGFCFLVDSKKFQDIDMLDEETFLYYEEHILSTKALKNGYKMHLVLDAKVKHLQGASSDISKAKWFEYVSKVYYLAAYKNYWRFFIKVDFIFNVIYSFMKCRNINDFSKNYKNIKEAKLKIKKYL